MKKWVCTVCGYVHEGETAPEFCPVCKVPASKFEVLLRTALLLVSSTWLSVRKS